MIFVLIALKEEEVSYHTSALSLTFSFDLCGPRIGLGAVSSNMVLFLRCIGIYMLCYLRLIS